MNNQLINQTMVVAQKDLNTEKTVSRVALFDEDGGAIDLSIVPSAILYVSGKYATASYRKEVHRGSATLSSRPRLFDVTESIISSVALGSVGVHGASPQLVLRGSIWVTNVDGTEMWEGEYHMLNQDIPPMTTLLLSDIIQTQSVGDDLSIVDSGGGAFSLTTSAGGFYFFGGYVDIEVD